MFTLTKPAGVAFQIVGGMFIIGAVVRLINGFSFGAIVGVAIGIWLVWEGGRPARVRK